MVLWAIKFLLQIFSLTVLLANSVKAKYFLSLFMTVKQKMPSIQFIMMFGKSHQSFLMPNTSTFVTFTDDYSRFTWILLSAQRIRGLLYFENLSYIKTQFSANILRSVRVVSMSHEFHDFLNQKGIIHNDLVHIHHNKMTWLKGRTAISQILFVLY